MPNLEPTSPFIFYRSENGTANIHVAVKDDTVWITQKSMADIFGVAKSTVSEHLSNIFDSRELSKSATVRNSRTVQIEGDREVTRNLEYYNLDAIISVGYRVNSYQATQFRIWATDVLKEYLIKGFALDDDRLKQGKTLFGKDYFDELIERIREIRASERRFYQKVTDIFIECSYDYDKNSESATLFFSHAQNKLEYAVTGMVAAEILKARADHNLPYMGITSWGNQKKGGKITQKDVTVAKNYLAEDETRNLNRLVNMFLDYAENLASKGKALAMSDWQGKLDVFLEFNEYQILQNYGKIKKKTADNFAISEYKKFRPIQDIEYRSDFDKAVEQIKATGKLPKAKCEKLKKEITNFDKKLETALAYNPKD